MRKGVTSEKYNLYRPELILESGKKEKRKKCHRLGWSRTYLCAGNKFQSLEVIEINKLGNVLIRFLTNLTARGVERSRIFLTNEALEIIIDFKSSK